MKKQLGILAVTAIMAASCQHKQCCADNGLTAVDTLVKQASFQKEVNGKKTDLYTLHNDSGLIVKITNYGGRIVSILTKDKNGKYADVTPGFSNIDAYLADKSFYGASIGRYANRIGNGTFKLNGKEYKLAKNNGPNSLHGGTVGFDKVVWDAVQKEDTLILSYLSPDMEEGYPGNLKVTLKYIITNNNELKMEFEATTDKPTVVNLTNHAYYNLGGEGSGDILNHTLEIFGDKTTPVDSGLIPTGQLADVKGTPFDFTTPFVIGARINDNNEQLAKGKGYDHNWVLQKSNNDLTLAARLCDTLSGRVAEFYSTEPAIQFYSGNFFNGSVIGKSGKAYTFRCALALEPQHYPDAPNKQNFPSTVLNPGQTYKHTMVVKFFAKK